jgi:hypothetical protein
MTMGDQCWQQPVCQPAVECLGRIVLPVTDLQFPVRSHVVHEDVVAPLTRLTRPPESYLEISDGSMSSEAQREALGAMIGKKAPSYIIAQPMEL